MIGWLTVDISFKEFIQRVTLFFIPTISQRLILGIDFWKKFNLIPNVIASVDLIDKSIFGARPSDLSVVLSESPSVNIGKTEIEYSETNCPLTPCQQQQLTTVISLFPNFALQGLGKTI